MRRALLLLFFFAMPLFAEDDPTTSLLTATTVKGVIQFEVPDKTSVVNHTIDGKPAGELRDGVTPTFAAPLAVELTYHDFNPFKVTVTSTETATADPSQKAIGDFLDALLKLAKGIAPSQIQGLNLNFVTPVEPESLQAAFKRWSEDAHGRTGIAGVRKEIAAKIDAYQSALNGLVKLPLSTPTVTAIGDTKDLLKALHGLLAMLDGYLSRSWRNDTDLVIRTVTSDPANQKTIKLTFTRQTYTLSATGEVTATTDVELERSLVIRRYRRFVPEVGVAAVYNELKYPKYTAEKQADNTFLVRKKRNDANVDAALTLNMLCNCFGSDFLFPGFQVGISKAEDYPGIMAGGVLRFAQPKKLSVAFGRMVTWYKDLGTLEVDKPVASEDALTKDLKRKRSPAAWYFAVQYTF
jgi:hypothetical protein